MPSSAVPWGFEGGWESGFFRFLDAVMLLFSDTGTMYTAHSHMHKRQKKDSDWEKRNQNTQKQTAGIRAVEKNKQ